MRINILNWLSPAIPGRGDDRKASLVGQSNRDVQLPYLERISMHELAMLAWIQCPASHCGIIPRVQHARYAPCCMLGQSTGVTQSDSVKIHARPVQFS